MNFSKYVNKFPEPLEPMKPGESGRYLSTSHAERIYQVSLAIYRQDLEEYNQLKARYDLENIRLKNVFWIDAFNELGLTTHPRALEMRSLAYDYVKKDGYEGLFSILQRLAEICK